ncbi:virus tail fiber assembly protein lambda gpK [Frischella perrara]|uniref:Caudovirales tail fiber assembly protein n=1 Tax=Frischella perrara TaxID=1267021 RepID=A0A0A7S0J4_FRIPE|nr:tail fiber assembly protein [Frischella perrara]AJA44968.1 Caudovirales tail fiber assembly protein [Frischella perrara]PWV58635.1 virus tail fiber assembly protein lambda gpK [Frischella perrara]
MKFYKNDDNQVYAYEDDVPEYGESDGSEITVQSGLKRITEEEFLELSKPKITKEDIIFNNKIRKDNLIIEANEKIKILEDIIELEMQETNEEEQLKEWKRYRIVLTRIDTNNIDIKFPSKPN